MKKTSKNKWTWLYAMRMKQKSHTTSKWVIRN